MPNPRLYPKLSNQAIVQSKGFDPSIPSPLSQAYSRRMVEQQVADAKAKDMKLSPLDRAIAGLEAVAMAGSAMFEAIQQAPQLLKGEDAYAEAIGKRLYTPRQQPEKAGEYLGNALDFVDRLQTEYKLPPIMPELAGFQPLVAATQQQVAQNAKRGALQAGMAAERALDKPVTDIMNRGGFGAQMLGSFNTQPAQVIKPKGGNWLGGTMDGLEGKLKRMKPYTDQAERINLQKAKIASMENAGSYLPESIQNAKSELAELESQQALNKWVESNMGNYIKKEMGTPEDPVRLMLDKRAQEIEAQFNVDMERANRLQARAEAETDPRRQANMLRQAAEQREQALVDKDFAMENATHLPKDERFIDEDQLGYLKERRAEQGFDPEGMAKSDPAKIWESLSDDAIYVRNAEDLQKQQGAHESFKDVQTRFLRRLEEIDKDYEKTLRQRIAESGERFPEEDLQNILNNTPVTDKARNLGVYEDFNQLQDEYFAKKNQASSGLLTMAEQNPWVEKLAPTDKLYSGRLGSLELEHVIDVIKQDVAEGRIRPEQLNKLSMDQAIKRTAEFNAEQAKKMRETAIKNMEGFPTYKEYGDEGYKWIELKQPEDLTELPPTHQLEPYESKVHGGTAYRVVNKETGMKGEGFKTPERATQEFLKEHSEERLADALRYEGDTMGHCVGGYCPDVLEGRSRIYSLRDKRGEPHVTVEVNPNQHLDFNTWFEKQPKELRDEINARARRGEHNSSVFEAPEYLAAREAQPPVIRQIKGKQNAAPKADYLPYVQDFVRSGQWSDVGDLKNTGLYKIDKDFLGATSAFMPEAEDIKHLKMPQREEALMKAIEAGDLPESGYATRGEWEGALRKHGRPTLSEADDELLRQLEPPEEGMKRGGRVHISDNPDTMAMELEDQKFQVGGIVDKAVRLAKAAKAAEMKQAMKASEALAKIEGKRLNITQADRTKVGQGFLGGPGFSGLQLQEGPHKDVGAVWGVKNVGTAKTMLGGFDKPLGKEYFTTMIGSPTQHQSNQMVFDKLYNQFKAEAKKGNLDPELHEKINARLAAAVDKDGNPIFPPDIDILDKNFKKQATTFDQRAIAGNVIGGTGVGGKKGQIIDYDKIIRETTDPFLLDAPSGSLGYRLWTPSGEIIERPDLHPAFPAIATGEDLGVEFTPAAQDILMAPWVENIRQTKGRNPGYMDWTRGRPPSVEVTEDILTNLQKSGNKAGGLIKVKRKAGGGIIKKAIQTAGKAATAPATRRLEMSFKDVAKPVPELTEASQKLKAGQLSREEYEALVNKHKPVTPYSFVPQPATAEDATRALNSAKREKFGKTSEIPAGTPAGLRLDIPAYKDHGVWVNSVHPDDMPTAYSNVSSVTDAEMIMPEDKALSVATREANKSPFAVIKGKWNPMSEEEAVAKAQEYLNHPDWVQVGIDPERHGYYYNRATMEPIVKAEEVIQIGPLVLAKNPVTAPKEAFKYARGGAINAHDLILTERPL